MSRFHQKSIQTLLFTLFAFPLFKVNIANLLVILLILICLSYNPRQILKFFTWENLKFTIPFWIILITSVFYFGQNRKTVSVWEMCIYNGKINRIYFHRFQNLLQIRSVEDMTLQFHFLQKKNNALSYQTVIIRQ